MALHKKWWPLVAVTALAIPVGVSAVSVAESDDTKRLTSAAKEQERPAADPTGAEEWMYLQRANAAAGRIFEALDMPVERPRELERPLPTPIATERSSAGSAADHSSSRSAGSSSMASLVSISFGRS